MRVCDKKPIVNVNNMLKICLIYLIHSTSKLSLVYLQSAQSFMSAYSERAPSAYSKFYNKV